MFNWGRFSLTLNLMLLLFSNRETPLPKDKIQTANIHLRHKLWTTLLKDHDQFTFLLDLFAAAFFGEATGGGLWRLSLIGGTCLITFYQALLQPRPSASSSLFSRAAERNRIHHSLIAPEMPLSATFLLTAGPTCPARVIFRALMYGFGLS